MIITAGVIGIGKSTVASLLGSRYNSKVFYESVEDNAVLEKFYDDKKRWAFPLQIHFLNTRLSSIKQALREDNNILDRSIYEDEIFSFINYIQGNMSKEELNIYRSLLGNMMEQIENIERGRPDLLVYLDGSYETMIERIKKRGRDFEQSEELMDYYYILHQAYKEWIEDYDKSPVIVIDMDKYDVTKEEDKVEVLQMIDKKLEEIESEPAQKKPFTFGDFETEIDDFWEDDEEEFDE